MSSWSYNCTSCQKSVRYRNGAEKSQGRTVCEPCQLASPVLTEKQSSPIVSAPPPVASTPPSPSPSVVPVAPTPSASSISTPAVPVASTPPPASSSVPVASTPPPASSSVPVAIKPNSETSSFRNPSDSKAHWDNYRAAESEKRHALATSATSQQSAVLAEEEEIAQDSVRTIRVFISSTFIDEHAERDVLVRKVFPELNVLLRSRRIQIVPVDLRWGVSTEQTRKIQQTCLNEIDRCRMKPDEAPWFIALRGERYGWVQDKYEPPSEFAIPENFSWLDNTDTNAQISITSMEVYHAIVGVSRIPTVAHDTNQENPHGFVYFRHPQFKAAVPDDFKWVFDFEYKSAEQIAQVAEHLRLQYTENPATPSYFEDMELLNHLLRSSPDACVARDYFPTFGVSDDHSDVIQTGALPNGKKFACGWVGSMEKFQDQVLNDLMAAIDREYPVSANQDHKLDPLDSETRQHIAMVFSRAKNFIGRTELVQKIVDHCTRVDGLLIVWGGSGSGKSSVIAKVCQLFPKRLSSSSASSESATSAAPASSAVDDELDALLASLDLPPTPTASTSTGDPELDALLASLDDPAPAAAPAAAAPVKPSGPPTFVIHHIVGATSMSCTLRGMLRRLCLELQRGLSIEEKTDPPHELNDLQKHFLKILKLASAKARILIIIDAINQLSDYPAENLSWIPVEPWPKNICIVMSTVPTENNLLQILRLRSPAPAEIEVEPMSREESQLMVSSILAKYHKELTSDAHPVLGNQMDALMSKSHANLPVYLVAAIEELRNYGIWEKLSSFLSSHLPGDIASIFNFVLDRLESDHGRELVSYTLSLIACSRTGLMEMEMIEILDRYVTYETDQDSNFSRLYFGLSIFISTGGSGLLQIFHSQLLAIVRSRYLVDKSDHQLTNADLVAANFQSTRTQKIHLILSQYFRDQANPNPHAPWSGDSPRAFSEIIYHMSRSGNINLTLATLSDLQFLAAKCNHLMAHDLADDIFALERVVESQSGADRSSAFVAIPSQSSSSAYINEDEGDDEAIEDPAAALSVAGVPTSETLDPAKVEDFMRVKKFFLGSLHIIAAAPAQFFNQALRCPESSPIWKQANSLLNDSPALAGAVRADWTNRSRLESACEVTFTTPIKVLAVSPDSKYVVTGGADGLTLWDIRSGGLVKRVEGHLPQDNKTALIRSLSYSRRGDWLASATLREVIVWNTTGYHPHWRHHFGLTSVDLVSFHPVHNHNLAIATSGYPRSCVSVWDISVPESRFQQQLGELKAEAVAKLSEKQDILESEGVEFAVLNQLYPFYMAYHRRASYASQAAGFISFQQEYDKSLRERVTPFQTKDDQASRKKTATEFLKKVGPQFLIEGLLDQFINYQVFVDKMIGSLPLTLSLCHYLPEKYTREKSGTANFVEWTPDGRHLLYSGEECLYIWQLDHSQEPVFSLHHLEENFVSCAFENDKMILAILGGEIYTSRFDIARFNQVKLDYQRAVKAEVANFPEMITKKAISTRVNAADSPLGKFLLSRRCFNSFSAKVDETDEDEVQEFKVWNEQFKEFYSPDRKLVSRALVESRALGFSIKKYKTLFDHSFSLISIPGTDKYTYCNTLTLCPPELESPTGEVLKLVAISLDSDKVPLVLTQLTSSGELSLVAPIYGHTTGVELSRFSRTGRHLVSATNKEVKVWNVFNALANASQSAPPPPVQKNDDDDDDDDDEDKATKSTLSDHPEGVVLTHFLWDDNLALTSDWGDNLLTWDFSTTRNVKPPASPVKGSMYSIRVENTGSKRVRTLSLDVLALSDDGIAVHWSGDEVNILSFDGSTRAFTLVQQFEAGHQRESISQAELAPGYQNRYLITAGDEDRSICVFDLNDHDGAVARRDAFLQSISAFTEEIEGKDFIPKAAIEANPDIFAPELYDNPNDYEAQLYLFMTPYDKLTKDQKEEHKDLFKDHADWFSQDRSAVLHSHLVSVWDFQNHRGYRIGRLHRVHDAGKIRFCLLPGDLIVSTSKTGDLCVSDWKNSVLLARLPAWRAMNSADFKIVMSDSPTALLKLSSELVLVAYKDNLARIFNIPRILDLAATLRTVATPQENKLLTSLCFGDASLRDMTVSMGSYASLPSLPKIDTRSDAWKKITRQNLNCSFRRTRVPEENKFYAARSLEQPRLHTLLGYLVINTPGIISDFQNIPQNIISSPDRTLLATLEHSIINIHRFGLDQSLTPIAQYYLEPQQYSGFSISNDGRVIVGTERGDIIHLTFAL